MELNNPSYLIYDLPVELLIRIFLQTTQDDHKDVLQPTNTHAPLQLCHVSSLWRAVARCVPQLWMTLRTRLTILTFISRMGHSLTELGRFISPNTEEFLNWWLSHLLPAYPLKVILDTPQDYRGYCHANKRGCEVWELSSMRRTSSYHRLFDSPFFRRIRELEMLLTENDLAMLNRTYVPDLTTLESVTVSTTSSPGFYYHISELGHFPPASRLTRLSITYSKLLSTFPPQNLTQLCIAEDITPSFLRRIFAEMCPNLVYATLSLAVPLPFAHVDVAQFSTISTVQHLRYLSLSRGAFSHVADMRHGLIFPSLYALRLHKASDRFGKISYEVFLNYLEKFPCLVELYLDETFFPVPSIFEKVIDFSHTRSLMTVLPQLGRVRVELDHGIRTDRGRDFYMQIILSSWIRPTNGPRGGRIEIQFPHRYGRLPSDYFFEDRLIGDVAAYWRNNRVHLGCDVVFTQANRKI